MPKKKKSVQINQSRARHGYSPEQKAEMTSVRRRWHLGTIKHFFLVVFTLILSCALLLFMLSYQIFVGPSQAGSDLLIQTLMESSAMKFYPYLFLRDEQVEAALERNRVISSDEDTDTSLITIKSRDSVSGADASEDESIKDIEIVPVNGSTFKGYMMIVQDPSRVSVGVCRYPFRTDKEGLKVDEIIDKYGAVAGINAGGFVDTGGHGNGGMPIGMVYSEGEQLNKANKEYKTVVGFDQNDVLHVGEFSDEKAKEIGLRDAVAFGPALLINGQPSVVSGKGSGLNPRSAIGQRADGAVLLLSIDGRQANSLGASYEDLIEIMLKFGAVNACNLDGGSSTAMFYNGEQINDGLGITSGRSLPTAWIVK
ncbi:MAG: phosphodiester glycosidase family protein [Clostridia bacterium]|nr:phosphodiester glycosidase family protein [Clostridia bacterium]